MPIVTGNTPNLCDVIKLAQKLRHNPRVIVADDVVRVSFQTISPSHAAHIRDELILAAWHFAERPAAHVGSAAIFIVPVSL